MYVIVATLQARADKRQAFLQAAIEDARNSVKNEPGCLRFDVYNDRNDPNKFIFVEVYKDEAAFQAHTRAPHFAAWREATKDVFASPPQGVRCVNVVPADDEWKKERRRSRFGERGAPMTP